MGTKVTLKQIADQAGVSLTTVHRVLNGKGGCSSAVKEQILRIAREQGYAVNMAAASLRKQPLHIALVFPLNEPNGRYFLNRILEGYLSFRDESAQFHVVFQEFYYGVNSMETAQGDLKRVLRQIYREQPVRYEGVVIYGMSLNSEAEAILNRIIGSGTKVVVLERSPSGLADICRVEVNDTLAGNLAGEMLSKCIHTPGTVVIVNQLLPEGPDPNGAACAACLSDWRQDLTVVQIPLELSLDQREVLIEKLREYSNLVGVYATCARHTHSLLRAITYTGIRPQAFIGSEMFPESYQALQNRTLDAVIDKHPEQIGYKALQLLMNSLIRSEPLPAVHQVTPRIILRANSDIYYEEKENLYGKNSYPK